MTSLDQLDRRILVLFGSDPQVGVLEASRRLGVARGTVQARLDRLNRTGVISTWAPTVSPTRLGFCVTAFVAVELGITGDRRPVVDHLRSIPEVLECWSVSGPGELLCQVVARSNADLTRVVDRLAGHRDIRRTTTSVGLEEVIRHRTDLLIAATTEPQ